jgi:hypothetical protein
MVRKLPVERAVQARAHTGGAEVVAVDAEAFGQLALRCPELRKV